MISKVLLFPTASYYVEDILKLKIGKQEYQTKLSYDIYLELGKELSYDVMIYRKNIKVNDSEIDTKFLDLSNQYMQSLFPLKLKLRNHQLILSNFLDIYRRINIKDKELQITYQGEGFEYIRSQFLNATNSQEKLTKLISDLYFIKVFNLTTYRFDNIENYKFQWQIGPIGGSLWKGNIQNDKSINQIYFEPKIENAQPLMDNIIDYIDKYGYWVEIRNKNVSLYTNLTHQSMYLGETGKIKTSDTNVLIEVEDIFLYKQQFNIKQK